MDSFDEMEASTFIGQEKMHPADDGNGLTRPLPISEDRLTPLDLTPVSVKSPNQQTNIATRKSDMQGIPQLKVGENSTPALMGYQRTDEGGLSVVSQVAFPNDSEELHESWRSELVIIDPSESANLPQNFSDNDDFTMTSSPEAPDLQGRIRTLTTAINAQAAVCRSASARIITLLQDNKHLYFQAEGRFIAYVLVPCLKLPGLVQRHVPEGLRALRECQEHVKHGLALVTGDVTPEVTAENRRLKDRIVEQDALLRESSLHRHQLVREREMLRRQIALLEHGKGYGIGTDDLTGEEQTAFEPQDPRTQEKQGSNKYDEEMQRPDEREDGKVTSVAPVLTSEQFRDLCAIVERRALAEASDSRRRLDRDDDDVRADPQDEFHDGDAEWTLL